MSNRNENPSWISRNLVRSREKAVLATVMRETSGDPYASLVLTACDHQGNPLTYISDLAEHTKNVIANQRASMLFECTGGLNDPLSGARVTLQGQMVETEEPEILERFHRRHEQSRHYGKAHKFYLYKLEVEKVHLVAGFGRIHWIDAAEALYDTSSIQELITAEEGIVTHMNEDHQDSIDLIANNLLSHEGEGWKMTGIDPEGFDMRLQDQVIRKEFDQPLTNAGDSRTAMIELVNQAKESIQNELASV